MLKNPFSFPPPAFAQKFKVEPSEVEEALNNGDYHSPLAVAYRLIMDNKRIEEDATIKECR